MQLKRLTREFPSIPFSCRGVIHKCVHVVHPGDHVNFSALTQLLAIHSGASLDTKCVPPSLKCGVVQQALYIVGTCHDEFIKSSSKQNDEEIFYLQRHDFISCGCANIAACNRNTSSGSGNVDTITGP